MRGQFETSGADQPDGYGAPALGADIAAIVHATGTRHLVGHSYGGLVAREAVLAGAWLTRGGLTLGSDVVSLTLMSSGPGSLTGPRAEELRAMLDTLGVRDSSMPDRPALAAGISQLWHTYLQPQFIAADVPAPVVAFLARRMLSNDPVGLVVMARNLLAAPDRTAELARLGQIPMLIIYGEDDN